ncbi:MAG: hypothetical protein PHC86_02530 [Eubacteriales bacterium]|nr:hypothetical protein [Eubacteriales bacterium]
MFSQGNFRVNFNVADKSDLTFPIADRDMLRQLAAEVAEIAARPINAEHRKLWYLHNALQTKTPLILCDPENGWNEIITEDQIQCVNDMARHWEFYLRKQIFWGNQMGDDYVVEPVFGLPYLYTETPWTVAGSHHQVTLHETKADGGAYHIDTVLESYVDIAKIVEPKLAIDFAKTKLTLELANEIFGDLLAVRLDTPWFWSFGMTDEFAFLRGMENLLFDFYDEPEAVHAVMKLMTDKMLARLEYLETNNLFSLNNDGTYVGSGGMGYTHELPADSFAGHVRMQDMWGHAESQITIGVSPEMFAEFIYPYQKKIMDRFGLMNYGCCEPMDDRFDIVKASSNLRRVSVSAWADRGLMADKLGANYIYSLKPNPAPLALAKLDEDVIRKDLRENLAVTRNSVLELIMKDNHTLAKNPRNLTRWVEIAREEIQRRG